MKLILNRSGEAFGRLSVNNKSFKSQENPETIELLPKGIYPVEIEYSEYFCLELPRIVCEHEVWIYPVLREIHDGVGIGTGRSKNLLTNGYGAMEELFEYLDQASDRGETIYLQVT